MSIKQAITKIEMGIGYLNKYNELLNDLYYDLLNLKNKIESNDLSKDTTLESMQLIINKLEEV